MYSLQGLTLIRFIVNRLFRRTKGIHPLFFRAPCFYEISIALCVAWGWTRRRRGEESLGRVLFSSALFFNFFSAPNGPNGIRARFSLCSVPTRR